MISLSGMGRYGDNRNHSSLRAIVPEDPVGAGCFLLGIGLEDLFPVRPDEGSKFEVFGTGHLQRPKSW